MSFEQFHFHDRITAGIRALNFQTPTPIQAEAIPPILAGSDVMGLAQTGTGKTAAFVLPILQRLMHGPRGRIRALIVAPTRELAEQIHDAIRMLGQQTGLRSVTLYGGVSINTQIQKLRQGAEIAVVCPGRLLDHIDQRTITLAHLEILVLDEADQMFDMGFLPAIRQILRHVPAKRQTLLFSATMPDDIRTLTRDALRDPVTVQIGRVAPAITVSHAIYPVAAHLKTALLLELLRHTETESVLIFTGTKHRAKRLGHKLEQLGYRATSLQGNLSQNRRQAALDGFRDGSFQILVATDIAARGIDVSSISHVINYDMPNTADAYTHRIGRTGRATRTGDALTLVTSDDIAMVRAIERILGTRLEQRTLPGFDYNAPAPARDTEFARPPREPQRRREPAGSTRVRHLHPAAGAGHPAQPQRQASATPRRSRGARQSSSSNNNRMR